jgi:hypothetical protein
MRPKPGCPWPGRLRKRFSRYVDKHFMWELIYEASDLERFVDGHDGRRHEFYVIDTTTGVRHAGARGFVEN